ncbi:CHASE domain-containing sensor histidine kinase [Larsenimonas rhizosphaerae]|uniref:CHASE domain-containing sensor histidine kinase n=1 Tax=Larsenimonas rhizosphaerae TaxID=2944682 RepID=UPI0020348470|nr:CHASE domain-containing protein [Larsenimonas rhizosphaerae]MCM2129580.1 CHASE domain-containing protein [Larsenimonas rhizosphaerae]
MRTFKLSTPFRGLPWAAAAVIMVATLMLEHWYEQQRDQYAQQAFTAIAQDTTNNIKRRMHDHELILRGGAGLWDASDEVSRKEWRQYFDRLSLDEHYPGILGFGYSRILTPEQVPDFERQVQEEGFSSFKVHPPGNRTLYSSILYLEPFSGRNLSAFGYDMYSQKTRRAAMERAVDLNETAMSARVTLVQETDDEEIQAGMLIYVPVYKEGLPVATREERWEALKGFVYSPYRMGDLMKGVGYGDVGFKVFDGNKPDRNKLMYASFGSEDFDGKTARFHSVVTMSFFGRDWTLCYFSRPRFENKYASQAEELILPAGMALALLAFILVHVLINRQQKAEQLARRMTRTIRHNERELQEVKDRQARVLAGSSDGWWEHNLEEDSVYFSERWWSLLGYENDMPEDSTMTLEALMHPNDRARTMAFFKALLSSDEIDFSTEFRLQHKDGHYTPFLSRGMVQRDHNGKAIRISGANTDLTERNRVDEMKRGFVSTVSHELRTPLTSIAGSLTLIDSGALGEIPDPMKPMFEVARLNSERLTLLINDLLDMDKLLAGKMTLELAEYALDSLVDESLKANLGYAEKFSIQLAADRIDPVRINVDALRFQQIISNFISNAIKFSPAGEQVRVHSHVDSNQVTVSITDLGPGIPEEFQERIFQKFSQADTSDTRTKGGTGLGLAIARELAEHMNATVGFDTVQGEGSTFWIKLPCTPAPAQA